MNSEQQLTIISVGVLIGQSDTSLDMDSFNDMEDFRIYLNTKYNINIVKGMAWETVFNEVKTGINKNNYDRAMTII